MDKRYANGEMSRCARAGLVGWVGLFFRIGGSVERGAPTLSEFGDNSAILRRQWVFVKYVHISGFFGDGREQCGGGEGGEGERERGREGYEGAGGGEKENLVVK